MLDHVTIDVSDIERSIAYSDTLLTPIVIKRFYAEGVLFAGYGIDKKAFFWIGLKAAPMTGMHIAFAVGNRTAVDRFHAVGLIAGGCDNGTPWSAAAPSRT